MNGDEKLMKLAIGLAEGGRGSVNPNPLVGAVVTSGGEIVGTGYHEKYGTAHAETRALEMAGEKAEGGTLYVTLEPCCHTGHTPPCTDAVIRSGIARVVVGEIDPNPDAQGKGVELLRSHAIEVEVGLLREVIRKQNRVYFKAREMGRAWVKLKLASTADAKVAESSGRSRWITSEESRRLVHAWRREADAVLVGIGTVLADDPLLVAEGFPGKRSSRIVVDSTLKFPGNARMLESEQDSRLILATSSRVASDRVRQYRDLGANVWVLPEERGRVDLKALMARCVSEGMTQVLCEGGPTLAGSLVNEGLVDLLSIFVAPKILGEGALSIFSGIEERPLDSPLLLSPLGCSRIGEDFLMEFAMSQYC